MRKLYTSELDIDDEHLDAFVDWYAFRHAPDIYQIGFATCTSYRGVAGDMKVLDLYEIDSVAIFDTAQYRNVAQMDPYSAPILAQRTDKAHSVYTQMLVMPPPVDDRPLLDADWISVERFEYAPPEPDALLAWLEDVEAERILLAGARRVRLARRTKSGPKHVSNRPRWLLLAEWPERPPIGDVGTRLRQQFGDALTRHSFFVGYRLYPWPDRPEGVPQRPQRRR